MKQSTLNNLVKKEAARAVVSRDAQPRQVIATAGKLRVSFLKGGQDGKKSN
jgi:hypothetical protein